MHPRPCIEDRPTVHWSNVRFAVLNTVQGALLTSQYVCNGSRLRWISLWQTLAVQVVQAIFVIALGLHTGLEDPASLCRPWACHHLGSP